MTHNEELREVISQCLIADYNLKNDDVKLLERVWQHYGWLDNRSLYDNLCRMPNAWEVKKEKDDITAKTEVSVEKFFREREQRINKPLSTDLIND